MKILLLDIETAPNLVHVWGLFKQNVSINQIEASGYVLSWAAKWFEKKEMMFDSINMSGTKGMIKKIHALLDEADVVVHYNGSKFDIPTLNKEMVQLGFKPPSPYKQVDLLHTARYQFRFPSNKLDYICKALNLGEKVRHVGHELWVGCMKNDPKSWRQMERYNRHDVKIMEKLYVVLLPWIRIHPNHGVYSQSPDYCCPNCGSNSVQRRGFARTVANIYSRYRCNSCGAWSREPYSDLGKDDRGRILRKVNN